MKLNAEKYFLPVLLVSVVLVAIGVGVFVFRNKLEMFSLPEGYTPETYTVEKVLDISCVADSDCKTPGEYLIQSRCPFTSLCLGGFCTVVCPRSAP